MPNIKNEILCGFNCNEPTTLTLIKNFEIQSGILLPKDYADFLCQTNGGEGFVGSAYLILWRLENLLKLNQSYQVGEYAPGLFLFGSDGGGEAFAFDTREKAMPVVSVPFIGMDLSLIKLLAENFNSFLEKLFRS